MDRLILLELNEVNFDYVLRYVQQGKLPGFARLLQQHDLVQTTSESRYEDIEPWIQWVTAHTGQTLAEHGIFRLGDARNGTAEQIWEYLEQRHQCSVVAMSPMNASNRTKRSSLFVPDPWTGGKVSGGKSVRELYESISRLVNDNATGDAGLMDMLRIGLAVLRYGGRVSWLSYLRLVARTLTGKWRKALILDLLLTDVFIKHWDKEKPDFSSLFLNAAAHIQHHYLFSSDVYDGEHKNPDWYVSEGVDPVLEVYELYDRIIWAVTGLPSIRVMIATGLHQDPHPSLTYYYRLREHKAFLEKLGLRSFEVLPRMSRDFLVRFGSEAEAKKAEALILAVTASGGEAVFSVDNRGVDLFCMLEYPHPIDSGFMLTVGEYVIEDFDKDVVFVAIKNGQHNGDGYFLDTGSTSDANSVGFPLSQLFQRIVGVFAERSQSIDSVPRERAHVS